MTTTHILLLLSPRAWAAQALDQVREGVPHTRRVINLALFLSGDLKGFRKW